MTGKNPKSPFVANPSKELFQPLTLVLKVCKPTAFIYTDISCCNPYQEARVISNLYNENAPLNPTLTIGVPEVTVSHVEEINEHSESVHQQTDGEGVILFVFPK